MNNVCQREIRGLKGKLPRFWGALMALGLAAALATACNGGGNGGESPTAQPTGEGSPSVQPTGQVTTSAACQALASLEKYRYVSDITLESPEETVPLEGRPTPVPSLTRPFQGRFFFGYNIDASLIMPDSIDAWIKTEAGEPFNIIAIGDKHWVSLQGTWQEVGPQYPIPYQPLEVCDAIFPELNLTQGQGEKETVNDVAAKHYKFSDTPSGEAMASIFGSGSDMDILLQAMNVEVWVAEKDGWPVRMDIQSSGVYSDGRELRAHIRIELRDVNNKDIKVEPPT